MKENKREKQGIIIFLVIICVEIIWFWGGDIITMINPSSYFTKSNIVKDIKNKLFWEGSDLLLNEKAGEFESKHFGDVEIGNVDVDEDKCNVELTIAWESSKPVEIVYEFDVVYRMERRGKWKISSMRAVPVASPEGLIGTWVSNVSQEGNFFEEAYNYDIEYKFERVDGNNITGTVTTYDRLGTEPNDTVPLVGTWNERTATLVMTFERGVSSMEFSAGDLYFDPADGLLKSSNEYEKID